jgi:hypothetical protein
MREKPVDLSELCSIEVVLVMKGLNLCRRVALFTIGLVATIDNVKFFEVSQNCYWGTGIVSVPNGLKIIFRIGKLPF